MTVRSPEGVPLQLRLAAPTSRIVAYGIDAVFVNLLLAIALLTFSLLGGFSEGLAERWREWSARVDTEDPEAVKLAFAPLMGLVLITLYFGELLYFSVFEALLRGRTPGKRIMKLRVVARDAGPLTGSAIAVRNLLRLADMLPGGYVVGLVSMVLSPHGRRVGDVVAGTLVIRTDSPSRPAEVVLPPGVLPLALSRPQLQRLGSREVQLARNTLRRVAQRAAAARSGEGGVELAARDRALLHEVAGALCRALGIDLGARSPEEFLQQVLKTAEQGPGRRSSS